MAIGKQFGILAVIALVFLGSCTNSIQDNQMPRDMMSHVSSEDGATKITSFERGIGGLETAKNSQIVVVDDEKTYQLSSMPVIKKIDGNSIRMYGYNGQIPGPLIKVKQGSTIYVNFTNNAEFETTIHWHGIRHDFKFDGVAGVSQEPIKSGESFLYKLSFPDAGVFWYHPHIREDLEQELGLYGNIIVEPKDENYFNKVDKEVTLFLDDLLIENNGAVPFDAKKSTFTLMGRFGNVMLLNGNEDYSLSVNQGEVVRFYLTDSANTRPFNFKIEGHKLKLIGSDIGKYEKEEFVDSVIISPGERYIVEALFDREGVFSIQHKTPQKAHNLGKINVIKSNSKNNNFDKLRENNDIKSDIGKFRKYFDSEPDFEFELTLSQNVMMGVGMGTSDPIEWEDTGHSEMMNRMSDTNNVKWIIKDRKTGKENLDIMYDIKKGDVKKIRIVNDKNTMHPMQHPIHLHGQRLLVLRINGKQNDNSVWKDTVLIPSGQSIDLLVDFSNSGEWMMHCHIAEHLEAGMMAMFNVV